MAREAPPSARLFVALELPEEARGRFVEWQEEAFGEHARALRPVPPRALHVTLAFLGHHPEAEIDAIAAAALGGLDGVAAPELTPVGVEPLPPRRPRLFAVDLADRDERAATVHAAVAEPLVAGGWYVPEKRPFWPHVTVARVRARAHPPRIVAAPPGEPFTARDVVLYRSRLSRAGADYEPLARMTLR